MWTCGVCLKKVDDDRDPVSIPQHNIEVCSQRCRKIFHESVDKPDFMFVDHGQHFEEIEQYVDKISKDWGFNVHIAKNDDLIEQAEEPGDIVELDELNERNTEEARRVNPDVEAVPFELDTELGNHLLKTVPMNQFIEENDIIAVINGVRWDEHESRADEDFFSPRETPSHVRVHPILQFREEHVWDATWKHMVPDTVEGVDRIRELPETVEDLPEEVDKEELPISKKYWAGYRSLGSETETGKSQDIPAWQQDLKGTSERADRAQNKDDDKVMQKLRDLGYMAIPVIALGGSKALTLGGI